MLHGSSRAAVRSNSSRIAYRTAMTAAAAARGSQRQEQCWKAASAVQPLSKAVDRTAKTTPAGAASDASRTSEDVLAVVSRKGISAWVQYVQ